MFGVDVILAAHGAGTGSAANELVLSLARRLQDEAIGSRVSAAFRRGEPTYRGALEKADRPLCIVVPLLTSDGYFAAELRREVEYWSRASRTVVVPPIGSSPALLDAIADRVTVTSREARFPPEKTSVVIVGHGTTRHRASGNATRAAAREIGTRTGLTAIAAFLDEQPTIEVALADVGESTHVIVVPFLLGGGDHAEVDVPARVLAAAAVARLPHDRIAILPPLGELGVLHDVIDEGVRDALGPRRALRAGARSSQLSRRQLEMVAARLAELSVDVRAVMIDTRGDIEATTPISEFDVDDPFAREITDALLDGRVDIAVHSAKDLPLDRDRAIVDAAFLRRGRTEDVLVTRTGARLSSLTNGARVGTSCARRAAQIRRLHPGVVPVPIRGNVPARVATVDRGEVDAVILAAAGLERLGLTTRIAERFSQTSFVPAPAQGAIVVQCRADSPYLNLLRRVDHPATRLAVAAEVAFARAVADDTRVAAAHAVVARGTITLTARLIDPSTTDVWDTNVRGRDPEALGSAAACELANSIAPTAAFAP